MLAITCAFGYNEKRKEENMDKKELLRIERKLALNLINRIEDETGVMFHEWNKELDDEIHGSAYNDPVRLKAIRVALAQEADELTMD
jgi:uncharacterized protein (DUF927 family)